MKTKAYTTTPLTHSHTSSGVWDCWTKIVLVITHGLASHLTRNKGKLEAFNLSLSLGEGSPLAWSLLKREARAFPAAHRGQQLLRCPVWPLFVSPSVECGPQDLLLGWDSTSEIRLQKYFHPTGILSLTSLQTCPDEQGALKELRVSSD